MDNEENRSRSESFTSRSTLKVKDETKIVLSKSDESILDKEDDLQSASSPGSSEAGTLKKPKKFRPKKFIQKRLGISGKGSKSSEELSPTLADNKDQESSLEKSASFRSEKSVLKSPKFNFVRKIRGKKSNKFSPGQDESSEVSDSNITLTKIENISSSAEEVEQSQKSDISSSDMEKNFSGFSEKLYDIKEDNLVKEKELTQSTSLLQQQQEPVTLESKKVQLKITISGKKIERVDKASSHTSTSSETTTMKMNESITLPRLLSSINNPERDRSIDLSQQNEENPITKEGKTSGNLPLTFAAVVREEEVNTTSTKGGPGTKEIEKYLVLTSSLNSIISAAKELDELNQKPTFDTDLNFIKLDKIEDAQTTRDELTAVDYEKEFEKIVNSEQLEKVLEEETEVEEKVELRIVEEIETLKPSDEIEKEQTKQKIEEKVKSPIDEAFTNFLQEQIHSEIVSSTPVNMETRDKSLIPVDRKKIVGSDENLSPNRVEVKFEVGTPVRPQRTSPAASTSIAPIAFVESLENSPDIDSNDDVFHSPKSDRSSRSDSFRRKIPYIPELSNYTPDEQELLRSSVFANVSDSLPPDSSIFPIFDDSAEDTMSPSQETHEHLYKILVIGELGTGKTSFIKRYVHQFFSQNYRATIGVDFALKVLNWDQSTIIRLQLWDIAGQERFGNMTRVYYKEAVGAFIVFDVTRSATFDAVIKWKQDLDAKVQLPDGSPIPCILLANKCDQQNKQGLVAMPGKMDEYCKENNFVGWYETSARDNINIEESAKALVARIRMNDKMIRDDMIDGDRLMLNAESDGKKKFCSC